MKLPFHLNARKIGAAAITVALAAAVYYVSARLTITHRANAQVKAIPFVLELHSYNHDSDPAGQLIAKRVLARRSDGTTISIHSTGPIEKGWYTRKIQYMDGRYVGVVDLISTVLRGSMQNAELAQLKARLESPPQNCKVDDYRFKFEGYEQVFGRPLARWSGESGNGLKTWWFDPALGCERLQSTVQTRQADGTLKLRARMVPISLTLSEPDQRLLDEPPSSYAVASTIKDLENRFSVAVQGKVE